MKTAKELGITPRQLSNLKKLAEYLRLKKNMKKGVSFDMKEYSASSPASEDCGSVGCAIGHGPYAGIKKTEDNFEEYCDRAFGLPFGNDKWVWCFAPGWYNRDNTPQGASKRITYMLNYGVPVNYEDQFTGKAPLCYK